VIHARRHKGKAQAIEIGGETGGQILR
jgi:hypothetical protein